MTLNRDDFPTLTEEQWNTIVAENDRRATDASRTAKNGMFKESEVQARINAALESERERLAMDEAQRLEADRKAFEQKQAEFAATQRQFTAKQKLLDGGLPADKVDGLLPLFAGVDDKALDTTITSFVTTYQEGVKAQVDAEKQTLLGNATPPAGTTTGPVDTNTTAAKLLEQGDAVGALDALIGAASGATTQ